MEQSNKHIPRLKIAKEAIIRGTHIMLMVMFTPNITINTDSKTYDMVIVIKFDIIFEAGIISRAMAIFVTKFELAIIQLLLPELLDKKKVNANIPVEI